MGSEKTFGGKRYSEYSAHGTKKAAKEAAGRAKRGGLSVKTRKEKGSDRHVVYARHGK